MRPTTSVIRTPAGFQVGPAWLNFMNAGTVCRLIYSGNKLSILEVSFILALCILKLIFFYTLITGKGQPFPGSTS